MAVMMEIQLRRWKETLHCNCLVGERQMQGSVKNCAHMGIDQSEWRTDNNSIQGIETKSIKPEHCNRGRGVGIKHKHNRKLFSVSEKQWLSHTSIHVKYKHPTEQVVSRFLAPRRIGGKREQKWKEKIETKTIQNLPVRHAISRYSKDTNFLLLPGCNDGLGLQMTELMKAGKNSTQHTANYSQGAMEMQLEKSANNAKMVKNKRTGL